MTTLVLADDHRLMRQGLKALLKEYPEFEICGEAENGEAAIKIVEKRRPDVLILDMAMPDMNGVEVTRKVKIISPGTTIIILSMHNVEGYVRKALQAGAMGYVMKDVTSDELVRAIHLVLKGERYLSPQVAQRAFDFFVDGSPKVVIDPDLALSKRERELLPAICMGQSAKSISKSFHISPRTVEFHRGNIRTKLGLSTQKELIEFWLTSNIQNK